jgi:hypothetical protein
VAELQVGAETRGDNRRFVVSTAADGGPAAQRFSTDRDGRHTVSADVAVSGDLEVGQGPGLAPSGGGLAFTPSSAPPDEAAPWSAYRTIDRSTGRAVSQLRFEIGNPGPKGDPATFRFVIGSVDDRGVFVPCLSVAADCTVTVESGDLTVDGQIVEGPIQADPDDPRFVGALGARWVQGAASAGLLVDSVYAPDLHLEVDAEGPVFEGGQVDYTISATNLGRAAVTSMEIHEVVAIGKRVVRRARVTSGESVEPNSTKSFDRAAGTSPGDAGSELVISVSALGLGPAGNLVTGAATGTVSITAPPS